MAGFSDLADRLAELEGIPSRIAREVAAEITVALKDEFDRGTDAYGGAWSPLEQSTIRRKRGDRRILRRTDALSSEIVARPTQGAGIEIAWLPHGEVHQAGDPPRMVARKILPDGDALPRTWSKAIEGATERAFAKALKP